jgi:hypothetical protein
MEIRNRFPKTASGPESSFSLTRQAQTNRYDRRIRPAHTLAKNEFPRKLLPAAAAAGLGARGSARPAAVRLFVRVGRCRGRVQKTWMK